MSSIKNVTLLQLASRNRYKTRINYLTFHRERLVHTIAQVCPRSIWIWHQQYLSGFNQVRESTDQKGKLQLHFKLLQFLHVIIFTHKALWSLSPKKESQSQQNINVYSTAQCSQSLSSLNHLTYKSLSLNHFTQYVISYESLHRNIIDHLQALKIHLTSKTP